jgi:hypothetical protein
MTFYCGSRARSVADYLSLRFDEKTRGLNAITFACMTIMSSGVSMYAEAFCCGRVLLGREEKVEGRTAGVHRPIQVAPLAFDPYPGA